MAKDLSTIPFSDRAHKIFQDYIDYFTIVERMGKSLNGRSKLEEVEIDLNYCKTRGFKSEEID
jgi:hypothetical protein